MRMLVAAGTATALTMMAGPAGAQLQPEPIVCPELRLGGCDVPVGPFKPAVAPIVDGRVTFTEQQVPFLKDPGPIDRKPGDGIFDTDFPQATLISNGGPPGDMGYPVYPYPMKTPFFPGDIIYSVGNGTETPIDWFAVSADLGEEARTRLMYSGAASLDEYIAMIRKDIILDPIDVSFVEEGGLVDPGGLEVPNDEILRKELNLFAQTNRPGWTARVITEDEWNEGVLLGTALIRDPEGGLTDVASFFSGGENVFGRGLVRIVEEEPLLPVKKLVDGTFVTSPFGPDPESGVFTIGRFDAYFGDDDFAILFSNNEGGPIQPDSAATEFWLTGGALASGFVSGGPTGGEASIASGDVAQAVTPVPLPGALPLMLAGIGMLVLRARRRA